MPWCPICKNEYRKGFTVCKDCNVPLVEEMPVEVEMAEVVTLQSETLAERLVSYLDYEIGEGAVYEELPDHTWKVSIDGKRLKKAKRCFEAFYTVEWEEFAKQELAKQLSAKAAGAEDSEASDGQSASDWDEDSDTDKDSDADGVFSETDDEEEYEDEEYGEYEESDGGELDDKDKELLEAVKAAARNQNDAPSASYVKKADEEKDMKSTAVTFFIIGIAGIIFLVFNLLGYFPMFDSVLSNLVFAFMFIGCILVGFNSLKRAKKAASEAGDEEQLTENITKWLDENLTKEQLEAQKSPELSDEANFLKELEYLKAQITEQFGELEETYLDYIAEEYYNEHFEE